MNNASETTAPGEQGCFHREEFRRRRADRHGGRPLFPDRTAGSSGDRERRPGGGGQGAGPSGPPPAELLPDSLPRLRVVREEALRLDPSPGHVEKKDIELLDG